MNQKLLAEAIGTAFLLIGVVGSGIMGASLSEGNIAIALLANAIATGCILYAIITTLGPISGAHFNPAVTLAFLLRKQITGAHALQYIAVQIPAAIIGVWIAHLMFDLSILQSSTTPRSGVNLWVSEIVATFGLLFVIFGGIRHRPDAVPMLVALYITGAYWFTSSTSFANPAVTIGRTLTDTFSGITGAHAPAFIAAQLVGAVIALAVMRGLGADQAGPG